jgi:phospho-N-acetylmuramoyl-pentapeptide-transferase
VIPWLISLIDRNDAPQWLLVFQYVTVRAMLALAFAFVMSVLFGNRVIAWLRALKVGQQVRDDQGKDAISLKAMHAGKQGTPTMGGLLMLGSLMTAVVLFGDLREPVLGLAVAMALGFGAIGFVDDYRKVVHRNSKGLSARQKLVAQGTLGVAFGAMCLYLFHDITSYSYAGKVGADLLVMPFFKEAVFALGVLYIPFAALVLTGTSNAVNLTDGLDGLATGVTITATICFGLVAYLAGRVDTSAYLMIPYVRGAGELGVLMAALLGGCFGFLWYNGYPAQVFMGDTGSMMIGGVLGAVALLLKQEFLLLIVGGVFVIEALSVIIQVTSYKLRQKRVFLMSPLHHHFERAGVPESHIIVRFWIVSALLAVAGLSTLKFR